MYLSTWPERWEPDVYLRALFHSKARGYYYKNTLVDDLLDQGINTFGPDERAKVYRKLHRTLYDDAPWVFLYKQKVGYGVGKSVNFEAPHDGYLYPYDYSFNP